MNFTSASFLPRSLPWSRSLRRYFFATVFAISSPESKKRRYEIIVRRSSFLLPCIGVEIMRHRVRAVL